MADRETKMKDHRRASSANNAAVTTDAEHHPFTYNHKDHVDNDNDDAPPPLQTTHSFPSTTTTSSLLKPIGSITGHRTISGTTTLTADQWQQQQQMLVDNDEQQQHRHRAHTAPAEFWNHNQKTQPPPKASPLSSTETQPTLTEEDDDEESEKKKMNAKASEAAASTTTQETTHSTAVVDEEDEELKLAMAMALAIQQNPKMTPAEIHALIGTQPKPSFQPTTTTASTLLPNRLATNVLTSTTAEVSKLANTTTTTTSTFGSSLREKIAGIMTTNTSNDNAAHPEYVSPTTGMRQMLPFRTKSPESNKTNTTETNISSSVQQQQLPSAPTLADKEEPADLIVKQSVTATATTTTTKLTSSMTPALFSKMADVVAAATAKISDPPSLLSNTRSLSNRSNNNIIEPKARLTGVAWKRRGGMGKYSTTSAWERRKISLVGTKLMYYLVDDSDNTLLLNHNPSMINQNSNDDEDDEGYIPPSSTQTDKLKTSTWFDQGTTTNTTPSTPWLEPETGTPRGHLDLAKEKATVHVAFGHSGAPTPYCISIKVRGETKWKLSFDRHSILMEWLAALTDVVVQTSVDASNAELLAAADPSSANYTHHLDMFLPPKVSKDDTNKTTTTTTSPTSSSTQLWMMEPYKIVSGNDDSDNLSPSTAKTVTTEDEALSKRGISSSTLVNVEEKHIEKRFFDTLAQDLPDYDDSVLNHAAIREEAKESAPKAWMIPEENLLTTVGILNAALFVARASSTSVDGFWFLVVFSNLALYLCLVEHPHWGSILESVRATPTTEQLLQHIRSFSKNRRKGDDQKENEALEANSKIAKQASVREKYIPKAGCSSIQLKEPTDPPVNEKGEYFAGWRPMSGDILQVRSHGYSATKAKVPSPGELYDCVAVDIFESPSRYPDMGPRVQLPEGLSDDGPKTWRSPDIFIISIALPTDPPKMGRSSSDGGGYTVTMYYRMKPETREILRRVTADGYDPSTEVADDPQKSKVNAVRLLEEWIRRSPNDPSFQARFKVVPNAHNLKEIGMPSWISKYNGKPFLIKRAGVTGFLHVHPELSCVEFDISLHPFPYLAKQAICFMKESYFKRILVTFGFVIEGRSDDELPECLIGLMQLCYPDPAYAIQAENFFNGTAPRSV